MSLHFILNELDWQSARPPGSPLLDLLREEAGLTAAKPGCREGDCGACAVLLGELDGAGRLVYRLVNTCLLPLSAVAGCHVLSVEGLSGSPADGRRVRRAHLLPRSDAHDPACGFSSAGSALNPVQRALVEEGGIQCGYCSPGLVAALTAHLLTSPVFDRARLLQALDGNLCRCTGYMGIKRAGERLRESCAHLAERPPAARLPGLIAAGILPAWLEGIPARLAALPRPAEAAEPEAGAAILGGGTDLLLQAPARLAAPWQAGRQPDLHGIRVEAGRVWIGAVTPLCELLEAPALSAALPDLARCLGHVASTAIRDRATLGGNLANASPIADPAVLLLALDADVLLRRHGQTRRLALSDFFLGYKRLALMEDEFIAAVEFPVPAALHFEKVAHRDHLDIASVNCAVGLELVGRRVRRVRLAAGGVAAVPLRLFEAEALLAGRELDPALAVAAAQQAAASVAPISDRAGSATYKRLLLRQLLLASLLQLAPFLPAADVLEALR